MNCNLSATGIRCPKLFFWCTWRDRLSRQRVTWELNGKHSFYRHDALQEYILVLFSYSAPSHRSDSRFCITQSRFCVTHVCFVDFVTHLCCYIVCHTFVFLHHELSSTYYCFYVTYCITHSYLYIKHSHFCITHSYFLSFMSHTAFTFPCTTELYVSHTLVITVNVITFMSHNLTAGKPRAHSFARWQQQERTWHWTCVSHLLVITVTLLRSATPSYSVSDNYRKAKSWLSNANSRNERCPVGTDRQTLPVMTHLQMCLLLLFFFTAVLLCWCLNQLLSNTKVEKR